jgi:PAS domain S-box-containing protein
MKNILNISRGKIEQGINKLNLGMRSKLILLFVIIKVIPLLVLTLVAWRQARNLGSELKRHTEEFKERANTALNRMGNIAVEDSVKALDHAATEQIERISTDLARKVADFLYDRDKDILYAAGLEPSEDAYRHFLAHKTRSLVRQREWILSPDGKSWIPGTPPALDAYSVSTNRENDTNYHNRPRELFETGERPLYLEMTYLDLRGNELVKITTSDQMDKTKRNVASRFNTYVKAETYFPELTALMPGQIYVSDVIGAYVRSRLIGMYTPENTAARGLEFNPEEEAYAGEENPYGKRFKGIIRWAAPVLRNGSISGYVTLALDHDHVMEFVDHITPMNERYVEMPSAYEGNYAFIWDYQCRNICHPRHHSIAGYNPETGEPEVPWLEDTIYNAWKASGIESWLDFVRITNWPLFDNQSRSKKPAPELTAQGLVGLDGRYLNNAPQCTGWFDLTKEGGSGSFLILWSGIWKPNTAATIPYYTGHYGQTKRGFGFVAIGAGLEDFQKPALETKAVLDRVVSEANADLLHASEYASGAVASNLFSTTIRLLLSAGLMIALVVLIAIWMASIFTTSITRLNNGIMRFRSGERYFRFKHPGKDEIGTLAASFDEMADSLVAADRGPLIIISLDYKIIYANEAALEGIGKTWDEIKGKSYREVSIYPPGSPWDPITALEQGKETQMLWLAGQERYYRGNATYLTGRKGEKIGYIITSTNVTEIIREQKKTAEQKALLDTVFDSSPDLIWYQDAGGRLLAANPRYASVFGRTSENIAGVKQEDLIPVSEREVYREMNLRVIESRKPHHFEHRLSFADTHEEILDTVLTPIFDGDHTLTGILGFARDVSGRVLIEDELRRTQEELRKAAKDATRASEYKGEFLARMSHEIRTPMNAIIGMTGIVKKKLAEGTQAPQEVMTGMGHIEASSQHLLGLLNDILDISKIEAGKIELSDDILDLPKLVNTVSAIIKPRCDEKNISFKVHINPEDHHAYSGDSLRLRQVLINLLGNAVKFTPETGTVEFEVLLKDRRKSALDTDEGLLRFTVRDTGIGISEESVQHLFKPFEQENSRISKKYGGTGLGLAISQSIVRLFGGEITLKSKTGEGSEFSFEIWLPETKDRIIQEAAIGAVNGKLKGKRALLVDDVNINRLITINMLEYTGLAIDEAGDGDEALEMFREAPEFTYDIIYMDVQMPNMNGYDASLAIRALDRKDAKRVPIVALTANAFKEDIDKALASGMNAHLAKPMELDKVLEVTFRLTGSV